MTAARWPAVRPYAANPARAAVQVVADVAVVVWCWMWVRLALAVHDAVNAVGSVGYQVRDGAGGLRSGLAEAARQAGGLPLVGDALAKALGGPFSTASGAAQQIADGGTRLGDQVTGLSLPLALVVALAPVLSVVLVWLPARYRFARRAGETAALAASPAGADLLALRALATRPVHQLTRLSADPVAAWRRGDEDVVAGLAALERRRAGLRA